MVDFEPMLKQLDELIGQYEFIGTSAKYDDFSDKGAEIRILSNRLESAIDRFVVPGSTYLKQLDSARSHPKHVKVHELYGIAVGLRDDVRAGWFESVIELVHADTYADFLKMAADLCETGYKDAAAVIAGTSLEVHLRTLCAKYGINVDDANGRPKKADTMNAELKKAGAYEGLQQKQVTAWLGLRNAAAHGNYTEYDKTDVRQLIEAIRAFTRKYAA